MDPIENIVEVFNRKEGNKGNGSPFCIAARQPQLCAALLCSNIIDLVSDELTSLFNALSDNAFMAAIDDMEWIMVRLMPKHCLCYASFGGSLTSELLMLNACSMFTLEGRCQPCVAIIIKFA